MTTTTLHDPHSDVIATPRRPGRHVGYAAAAWAAAYGVLALIWTLTGRGYPFGSNDPDESLALLRNVSPEVGAPVFAGVLLSTAVAAFAMAGPHAVRPRAVPRLAMLWLGWGIAAALALAVPTVTMLAVTGYAPLLILGAPFGWPSNVEYARIFDWSLANQAWCMLGGVLVAATVLRWQRRTRGACERCGRRTGHAATRAAAVTASLSRWAVGVAIAIPLVYVVIRYAWVLNLPIGIGRGHLEQLRAEGGHWVGAGLATFALVGALLTLGLVQRWGEIFPRWMPGLGGRRVPIGLAVIPASYVALIVFAGTFAPALSPALWRLHGVEVLPLALMPLWAVALGVATYAYRLRRRGRCGDCGQDG